MRFVCPKLVEDSDKVRGVFKVSGQLPGRCVIAFALDKGLEVDVVKAADEVGLGLPLLLAIDNNS